MPPVSDERPNQGRPIIVCPLEFERAALRRAGVDRWAELCCCGPGSERMAQWWAALRTISSPIILAGVAGSLNDSHQAGCAWWISEVVDARTGTQFVPSWFAPASRCIITSVDQAVGNPAAKERLHLQTGADLVDMESLTFARCAAQREATWAIVRGVSDGAQSSLPKGINRWVNQRGQTQGLRVLVDLVRRPREIRLVRELHASSRRAMAGTSALLSEQFGK